jgi:hypothetical protein
MKMKKLILIAVLTALSGVIGYQIGIAAAPKYDTVQLVLPPTLQPPQFEKL